jgi:hypothetical protein
VQGGGIGVGWLGTTRREIPQQIFYVKIRNNLRLRLHLNRPNSTTRKYLHIDQRHRRTENSSGGYTMRIARSRQASRRRLTNENNGRIR